MIMLSNTLYDKVKWFVQIVLPAFGALYFGLAGTWDLPASEQVVGTCAIIATFLGAILGISTVQYNASPDKYFGTMRVYSSDLGKTIYSLELETDPEDITNKNDLLLKVDTTEPPTPQITE